MMMVKDATSEGKNGRPSPEGASLSFPAVSPLHFKLVCKFAVGCLPTCHLSFKMSWSCRRAAHFAHFGADDEEEDGDNLHTGGTEVCLLSDNPHILITGQHSGVVDDLHVMTLVGLHL